MKLIIAGSRDFHDYSFVKECVDDYVADSYREDIPFSTVIIVSGHCTGVDTLGERYARERGCRIKTFKAEWDRYGKQAGPKRNKKMADYADMAVIFWDGKIINSGSKNMIDQMQKAKKPYLVVPI